MIYINVGAAIAGDERSSAERGFVCRREGTWEEHMRKMLAASAAAIVVLATAAAGVAVAEKVYNIPRSSRLPGFNGSTGWIPA